MSDYFQLIKTISAAAQLKERVALLEQIANALPGMTLPIGLTTDSTQAGYNGDTLIVEVDSTTWMQEGMTLQIGTIVDGLFRGFYGTVLSKVSPTTVSVSVLGVSNMLQTEVVPSGASITLGAFNGVRTATVQATNSSGWMLLKAGGNWFPSVYTSAITAYFYVSDQLVAQRTITATLDPTTGLISTDETGVVGDVGIQVLSTGAVFSVRFTYMPSVDGPALNLIEKTLTAQNFSLADGARGLTGQPGYAAVYGVWDTFFTTPANLGYQVIVKRTNTWYVTKDTVTPLGPLQGPPLDDSASNTWWQKITPYYNVATGLMPSALVSLGENSQYFRLTKPVTTGTMKLEVSGVITPQRGSLISNRFVDTDIAAPSIFPVAGTYDELKLILSNPSLGAKIYFTDDGSTPDNTDTLWNSNLLVFSEKLDESVWQVLATSTVVSDAAEAPNPAITAFKGVGGPASFGVFQELLNTDAGGFITKGNYFAGSIYVKSTHVDVQNITISVKEYDGTTYKAGTSKSFPVSNTEWTRVFIAHKVSQTSDITDRIRIELTSSESTSGIGEGFLLSMAQLEFGELPSFYSATTTARAGVLDVTASATIKAIAEKFGVSSYVRTAAYVLPTVPGSPAPTDPVSQPYASPYQGSYDEWEFPLYVELFCNTPGATIYYTLDGSTPSAASTEYTGGLDIEGHETIRAIAILAGRPDSGILTANYVPINYSGGWYGY